MNHVGVEIVRKGSRCTNSESGNDREDRGKGNRRHERKEHITAERLREQWGTHIGAAVCRDGIAPNDRCRAEAKKAKAGPGEGDARGLSGALSGLEGVCEG